MPSFATRNPRVEHAVDVGPARIAWALTSAGDIPPGPATLSAEDQARAAAFGTDRRREFLTGRDLVARLIDELFPGASGWSMGAGLCRRCGQRHGPVELTGVPAVAGVSYARGIVVAAVTPMRSTGRLGIDVELDAVGPARARDLENLLGRARQPLPRRWTRIEAVLKADGRGLLVEPTEVRLRRRAAVVADAAPRYRVADVPSPPGYVISLAWSDAESSAASSGGASG